MKYKILLSLFCVAIMPSVNAQISNFDLSKYQLPDLKRNTLETDFSANGANSRQRYDTFYNYVDRNVNNNDNSLGLNSNIHFNNYRNSPKTQRLVDVSYQISADRYKVQNNDKSLFNNYDFNSQNSSTMHLFSVDLTNRRYVTPKLFFATNFEGICRRYLSKSKDEFASVSEFLSPSNFEEYKTTNYQASGSMIVPLQVGIGRINQVQDARHAVYIFDELAKQGRIGKQPTDEEVLVFAEFISQQKNRRFFDSRHQKIAELEAIDSFLLANNFVTEHDARYFTTLEDFWSYGGLVIRESGNRISFGVTPGYYFHDYDYETTRNQPTTETTN